MDGIQLNEKLIKESIKKSINGDRIEPDYLFLQSMLNERMQLIHNSVFGKRMDVSHLKEGKVVEEEIVKEIERLANELHNHRVSIERCS